jgi:energy-converting hydrogenase Eha subunit A
LRKISTYTVAILRDILLLVVLKIPIIDPKEKARIHAAIETEIVQPIPEIIHS